MLYIVYVVVTLMSRAIYVRYDKSRLQIKEDNAEENNEHESAYDVSIVNISILNHKTIFKYLV